MSITNRGPGCSEYPLKETHSLADATVLIRRKHVAIINIRNRVAIIVPESGKWQLGTQRHRLWESDAVEHVTEQSRQAAWTITSKSA